MIVVRRARMFYCKTVFLNSSTPKMFVSAQSALEQKKKIRKATKFTSLKYPSKPCVNKSTENLAERVQYSIRRLACYLRYLRDQ